MSYENPEKKVQTSASVEKIIAAIKLIPECLPHVKMEFANDDFSFYMLQTAENGLNMGANLEISVSKDGEYTNVHFLCRRKVDFIHMKWEYDDCHKVIEGCMNLISKALKGDLKKQ